MTLTNSEDRTTGQVRFQLTPLMDLILAGSRKYRKQLWRNKTITSATQIKAVLVRLALARAPGNVDRGFKRIHWVGHIALTSSTTTLFICRTMVSTTKRPIVQERHSHKSRTFHGGRSTHHWAYEAKSL
ncbi:hypothetical protein AVEN_165775-1 [Araneus ventricosus]|uniref:Uncharacterized protein n=1 Tax=Araneus ventricosus TaxID=182803 RepID=A0A4Y2B4M2_ARAVE|nr:hypothetical protein AVEN_165775-1 [Araneus ventricosus]